jgi:hypothetical protein
MLLMQRLEQNRSFNTNDEVIFNNAKLPGDGYNLMRLPCQSRAGCGGCARAVLHFQRPHSLVLEWAYARGTFALEIPTNRASRDLYHCAISCKKSLAGDLWLVGMGQPADPPGDQDCKTRVKPLQVPISP